MLQGSTLSSQSAKHNAFGGSVPENSVPGCAVHVESVGKMRTGGKNSMGLLHEKSCAMSGMKRKHGLLNPCIIARNGLLT
mmetsp:Transcript_21876/g.54907  ORF Transcript_21876/g.54907 Transcript_21876/m.54907 type:complete len:80 (+) Transcript_21876:337-576(+)